MAIDEQLVRKERRLQALSLLSAFVRLQPPHLHLVLETPIIENLYNCILIDTSGTVVDLALTALIMFLPHITTSLVYSLPKLFVIYSRILCWDIYCKDGEAPAEAEGSDLEKSFHVEEAHRALESDPSWEPLPRLFNTIEAVTPKANYLFTFLYGLFPLNFMNFIRKPRRYLKMKNYPGSHDLNLHQDAIRQRTETHRATHKLHPNFFLTTPEDELTDNRWLKSDPADLVSECLGLYIASATTVNDPPGPPPTSKLPDIPKAPRSKQSVRPDALLAPDDDYLTSPSEGKSQNSSWRHTQSTTLTAPSIGGNAFEAPKPPMRTTSSDALDPQSDSTRDASTGAQTREASPAGKSTRGSGSRPQSRHGEKAPKRDVYGFFPAPPLQIFAQALSRSPDGSAGTEAQNTAMLQREVMLLKNDLNFERFQKQQYLNQIGQLQRKHIKDATVESQNQNVLNAKKTLTAKLEASNKLYAQLKKEAATSRNQSKKFEEQLTQKLKAFKEEEKQWQSEVQMLRHECEKAREECDALRQIIVENENREQDSRDQLTTQSLDLQEMDSMQQRLQELEERLRDYQFKDLEIERAREDQDLLRNELEAARMNLDSRDAELDRMTKTYEQKLSALESRLRTAQEKPTAPTTQLSASVQQYVDNAMASSQSKLQQVKKNYTRLLHKYTELELKCQELESGGRAMSAGSLRPSSVLSLTQYADDAAKLPLAGSRDSTVGRLHSLRKPHAFSDPLILEDDFPISPIDESPRSNTNSSRSNYADRSQRFESLAGTRPLRGISPPPHDPSLYEHTAVHDFHANTASVISSRHASQMMDGSAGPNFAPAPEIRMHGRGQCFLCTQLGGDVSVILSYYSCISYLFGFITPFHNLAIRG
jgi:hypothetical protein